jgi:hypothetical protein
MEGGCGDPLGKKNRAHVLERQGKNINCGTKAMGKPPGKRFTIGQRVAYTKKTYRSVAHCRALAKLCLQYQIFPLIIESEFNK